MRRLALLLIACCMCIVQVWAQTKTVTGKVTDQDGKPVSNASVLVKGTNTGTTSNSNGSFSLTVSPSAKVIVFSGTGFEPIEYSINNKTVINATLQSREQGLQEVVVVGYGTQRRSSVTAAVSKLSDSTLRDLPIQGPDQALRGRVAGVIVNQSSGTPGSAVSVQIRGIGSISNSTQPLYVVDGVIINTGNYSQIGAGGQTLNALSDINPNDIESFEVLKDAAAAAVYGARGANGVVLITTKRGANQRTKISFNTYYGPQKVWKKIQPLTGPEFVQLVQEEVVNRYGSTVKPSGIGLVGMDNDPSTYPTTNWIDSVFRTAPIANYELNLRGGNERTKFFISGNYFDQQGTLIDSRYQRFSTRMNLDNNVTSKFKISTGLSLSRSITSRINNDNNIYGVLSSAILLAPYFSAYNADGTYAHDPNNGTVENPLASARARFNKANTNRILASAAGEYQILRSLSFRSQVSIDYVDFSERSFLPSTTLEGISGPKGVGKEGYDHETNLLNENILTYRKTFAQSHNITFTGVASYQKDNFESLYGQGSNFPGNDIQRLSAAAQKVTLTSTGTSFGVIGYLGRLNYDYKSKYLLSGSVRRDGSSRLGSLYRWGTFPAVSGAWRVNEENFMKGISAVNELKIRASYGKLGNSEIGNFASRALVSPGYNYNVSGSDVPGLAPSQLGNDSLRWETSVQKDIGIDIGVLKNRVQLTVDYFNKRTKDLITSVPLIATSGFTGVTSNLGEVENKGWEFSLNTTNISTKSLTWTSSLNISFIKNKVLSLSAADYTTNFASRVAVGQALGSFYGYRMLGIFQSTDEITKSPTQTALTAPGDIKFADLNGDGKITSADQEILGTAVPKYFGGFTNTVSFKGFELTAFLQFVQGNKVLNYTNLYAMGMNSIYGQFSSVLNRWTPTNTNTNIPRAVWGDPNTNRRTSDRFVEDGSYARLKNILLAYNLPQTVLNTLHFSTLKVYMQAQNLVTWTKYSGFDPEVSYSGTSNANTAPGVDFLTYPQPRSITFGINATF